VAKKDQCGKEEQPAVGKAGQKRQQDHACADRSDHFKDQESEFGVEGQSEVDD